MSPRKLLPSSPEAPKFTVLERTAADGSKHREDEHHPGTIEKRYAIKVITPIFGGGVEAGINDPVTPIRGSTIRGHLRFWWRATLGAACKDAKELRQREGEIWGTTDNPSPVQVEVQSSCAQQKPCANWQLRSQPNRPGDGDRRNRTEKPRYRLQWQAPFDKRDCPLPYVLFPFQGTSPAEEDHKDPSKYIPNAEFTLTIRFLAPESMETRRKDYNDLRVKLELTPLMPDHNDISKDIEAAVWAWVNFGGYGSRTRRGCGALFCTALAPASNDEIKKWIGEYFAKFGVQSSTPLKDWPILARTLLVSGSYDPSPDQYEKLDAWMDAVELMRQLRQGEDLGREPGRGAPGPSRWPEPESIRDLVLDEKNRKERPATMRSKDGGIPTKYFPRAEFGMPIIFELRNDKLPGAKSAIKPTLCYSKKHDRLASPVILRPLGFLDGSLAPMLLVLKTTLLESAWLKPDDDNLEKGKSIEADQIRSSDLRQSEKYPKSPLGQCQSAIDALIECAKKEEIGFEEVWPE